MKKVLVYAVFLFITIFVFEAIAKRFDPEWGNNPIEQLSGMYIAIIFSWGFELYSWKSDLSEFLRRVYISIPFAIMFSVLVKVLGYDFYQSLLAGMFISILLLLKTPDWKKHFVAILIASCVFVIVAKFFFMPWDGLQVISFAKQGVIFFGFILTQSFFLLYLAEVFKQAKTPDLKPVIMRSVKFSLFISIFFALYLTSNHIGNRLELNLPVQLFINTVIAILFLLIGYRFDLLLVERKKWPKKRSRISELHNELNEFYFKEREKTQK